MMNDNSSFDSGVFKWHAEEDVDHHIHVKTTNVSKAGLYDMRIKMDSNANPYDTRTNNFDFQVELIDSPCIP